MMEADSSLAADIGRAIGARLSDMPADRVHGGSINHCVRWQSDQGPLFVKLAAPEALWMFEAEAEGLAALAIPGGARVPQVLGSGRSATRSWLALEWVDLAKESARGAAVLGEALARQHGHSGPRFGWSRDNVIGASLQPNGWHDDWVDFFREKRLRHQLQQACSNGHGAHLESRGALLLERLHELFSAHRPEAALLHGDLWGGNWGCDHECRAVLFDPAVYYGDRETDLAMTRLFGGFGEPFYRAYAQCRPLDAGAAARVPLYNLYHMLNHLNLFGAGYLASCRHLIDAALAETGH